MAALSTSNMFDALATKSKGRRKPKDKKDVSKQKEPVKAATDNLKTCEQLQGKRKKSSKKKSSNTEKGSALSQAQYKEWARKDQTVIEELYEKDLQHALLLSKLNMGQEITQSQVNDDVPSDPSEEEESSVEAETTLPVEQKPKSKKIMSLSDFQRGADVSEQSAITTEPAEPILAPVKTKTRSVCESADGFFNDVVQDAKDIIKREKRREESKKQFKVQSTLQAKYKEQMEQKDVSMSKLQQLLNLAQEELKQVKKRNKQLCFILGQGEMKEKSELLEELDNLNQAKDELTSQLSDLSQELEKERSKNHALQAELVKAKSVK